MSGRGAIADAAPGCEVSSFPPREVGSQAGGADGSVLGVPAGSEVDVRRDMIHRVEIVGDQGIGGLPRIDR
jgi:hypothetical protein